MKNSVFTTILSFFALSLYGQSLKSEGEFYVGLGGGVQYSKVTSLKFDKGKPESTDKDEKKEANYGRFGFGFQIGGFAGYHFSDDFALQLEVLYSLRNSKGPKGKGDENYSEFAFRNHYLDIPVLVKYYPVENFYIHLGPQLGFALSMQSKKNTFESNKITNKDSKYEDVNEGENKISNKINFAGVIGVGYDITENFNVDLRYVHGFAPTVYDADKATTKFELTEAKGNNNSMFQLGVGYTF